ncbi:MAG: hypothetical protein NT175_01430 [Bacteroidetes bacterium]|nr:hypothetical protein [Bacteroidota bacterium]
MDPNLYHLDYEKLFEVLLTIVFLSIFIERALALLFESRAFIEKTESGDTVAKMKRINLEDPEYKKLSEKKKITGLKELISLVVAVAVCWIWKFDALTILFVTSDQMHLYGYLLTGAVIAGGSKGSVKLFKDTMGIMSSAEKQRESIK